jgi:hypothetical protein
MSIIDYASLQTSIASWLHRTDSPPITDFIALAEARMNGDIESRSMETRVTLSTIAATRTVALPTDMLEMRRLIVTDTDPVAILAYRSPDELVAERPYITATSRPIAFTVIGANIELAPTPDGIYPLELVYLQRIPALSNSNTTNWLIAAQPNAYLFGALVESAAWTQDEARLAVWERKYQEAIHAINSIDWYSGSTLRVRSK